MTRLICILLVLLFSLSRPAMAEYSDFACWSNAANTTAKAPLRTATKSQTPVQNAFGHWQKHGAEFPEFQNVKQCVEGTKSFSNSPPKGTLTKVRPNGDNLFFNPANNTFGVQAADGAPRTMFRPTDGINYWNKQ